MTAKHKKTGLFFGSFNPVHTGHMIIANYMANYTDLDEVWMVVSPQNPHKLKANLANDYDRLHLVRLAIGDNIKIKASNVEFDLPKPSFTVDTLTYLKEMYITKKFVLLMGGDNLSTLNKWKNYETILANHEFYVYKRSGYDLGELAEHSHVKIFDAPLLDISATYIRTCIKAKKSIQYLVPELVYEYLSGHTLYS